MWPISSRWSLSPVGGRPWASSSSLVVGDGGCISRAPVKYWWRNALDMSLLARTLVHIMLTMRKSGLPKSMTWRVTISHGPSSSIWTRLFEHCSLRLGFQHLASLWDRFISWWRGLCFTLVYCILSCITNIVIFQVLYDNLAFDVPNHHHFDF